MSFWNKVQASAKQSINQTSTFLADSGTILGAQAGTMKQSFSLTGECDKASNILRAFLADPHQPQSALNGESYHQITARVSYRPFTAIPNPSIRSPSYPESRPPQRKGSRHLHRLQSRLHLQR